MGKFKQIVPQSCHILVLSPSSILVPYHSTYLTRSFLLFDRSIIFFLHLCKQFLYLLIFWSQGFFWGHLTDLSPDIPVLFYRKRLDGRRSIIMQLYNRELRKWHAQFEWGKTLGCLYNVEASCHKTSEVAIHDRKDRWYEGSSMEVKNKWRGWDHQAFQEFQGFL